MKRLDITVPDDFEKDLETIHNKDLFITEALREKLERKSWISSLLKHTRQRKRKMAN